MVDVATTSDFYSPSLLFVDHLVKELPHVIKLQFDWSFGTCGHFHEFNAASEEKL